MAATSLYTNRWGTAHSACGCCHNFLYFVLYCQVKEWACLEYHQPCVTVHHLTHPNHNVPLCAPEESIRLMLRNLTGSPLAPQRHLACLSARVARKGGEEQLNPLPQLPSIIHIQWPINPPVLFFSDPPFNFHIYHFHISHYPIPFWYSYPSFSISFLFSALDTAFSLSKRFSTFL